MKLPDFLEFEVMNALRREMGATELIAVRGPEWQIATTGIDVEDIEQIRPAPDATLVYAGHRVLVYIRDQFINPDGSPRAYRFHVAECKTLSDMRRKNRFSRYVATTRADGRFIVNFVKLGEGLVRSDAESPMSVCKYCLESLDWQGYAKSQAAERKSLWNAFTPALYFERYAARIGRLPIHTETSAPLNVYSPDWSVVSRDYRASVEWRCEGCGSDCSPSTMRKNLHTHHRDGNKANNRRANLQALCERCHAEQPDHQHMRYPLPSIPADLVAESRDPYRAGRYRRKSPKRRR